MNIIYSPQRGDMNVEYSFDGEAVTATIGDTSEIFDFTGMPDGRASNIQTDDLPVCPIVSAERVDGELIVRVLNWYGANANESEKRERTEVI